MVEKTYVMLKPDAVARGLIGKIITRIEEKGLKIIDIKMFNLTQEVLREHYSHIVERDFYPEMENFMMSGPVVGMIVGGENAISATRQLMGATKWLEAAPGTIRADYASGVINENLIHGSDSKETAEMEIKRFFN